MPPLGKRFLGLVLIASFSSCFALPSPFSRGSHYLGSVLSLSKVLLLILKISLLILNKFFNQTQPPFFLPPLLGFEQVSPECSTETPRKVSFLNKYFPPGLGLGWGSKCSQNPAIARIGLTPSAFFQREVQQSTSASEFFLARISLILDVE